MVLPEGIELSTSPLPRECSTTELRQQKPIEGRASGLEVLRGVFGVNPRRPSSGGPSAGRLAALGVGKAEWLSLRPSYHSRAVQVLDGLVKLIGFEPAKSEQSRSSSGVEQRIRNAWVGGSIPSCGTNKINDLDCHEFLSRCDR